MGSNPGRKLSLLGFAHPVERSLFQVQGVCTRAALTKCRIFEESQVVALVSSLYNMYYNVVILIYVESRVIY